MKTLLINNHTKHLVELCSLFDNPVVIEKEHLTMDLNIDGYDLIVFSGGSNVSTVLENPEEYFTEMDIIKQAKIPVLGICLGLEIIVKAFGGELQKLSEAHRGNVQLKIEDSELKLKINSDVLNVSEGHGIGIRTLPEGFISCASSEHGIEIIKHRDRAILGLQFHPEVSSNPKLIEWIFGFLKVTK